MSSGVLILTFNKENDNNYMLRKMNEIDGISVFPVLKQVDTINKFQRIIDFRLNQHIDRWLSHQWINKVDENSTVICIANGMSAQILSWIKHQYNCRCINYYWDKVSVSGYPVIASKDFENWSFDNDDCGKYGMKFNPQFYVDTITFPEEIIYDITFVGGDRNGKWKNRACLVSEYYHEFTDVLELSTFFYFVSKSKNVPESIKHSTALSMEDFIKVSSCGRAMLEIVEPSKCWITQRPFFALSNKRKLITNNKKIIEEPFYSPRNIFILDRDDFSDLKQFIYSPFDENCDIEYYSMTNWKDRFLNNAN